MTIDSVAVIFSEDAVINFFYNFIQNDCKLNPEMIINMVSNLINRSKMNIHEINNLLEKSQ